ncbi:MAG: hypothetical protein JWN46_3125 [Acidimicrobiales bacterium]|nr:hypothetical protein [Acidimicrobiales bacterium]
MGVVLFLLVVVIALVIGAVVLLRLMKHRYVGSGELVPGQHGVAPDAWAGSHDPEALLHRRLRDALAALRANQAFDDDGALLDVRVTLEQEALGLDQRLVAIAALAPRLRAEPLARATEAVETIEETVASTVGISTAAAAPRLQAALDQVRARTDLVGQAWAELTTGTPAAETVTPATPAPEPAPLTTEPPPPPPAAAPLTDPPTKDE